MDTPLIKRAPAVDRSAGTRPALPPATIVGLGMTLLGPLLYGFLAPILLQPVVSPIAYSLLGVLFDWLIVCGVLVITLAWEQQPLASLGLRLPSWRLVLLGIGLGAVMSVSVPLLGLLASRVVPPTQTGVPTLVFAQFPAWLVMIGVVSAVVLEELVLRAYPLERLRALTGRTWPGVVITLTVFVLLHLHGWNLAHVVGAVLPLGAILTGLYLWRRNLPFVLLIHLVIDLPLFLISIGALPPL